MVITRQTMIQGRHSLPSGIDIAMRKTLAGLPEKQVGKQHSAHRGITLAACAAVVVFGVAVASIPSAKAYAEGLFRSVFGLFAGEPDNGIAPPVQSDSPSAYEQGEQVKYKILSANSVPVNVWQTSNGVTATVLEAAVAEDKLFMGLEFTGLPQYCYPAEEFIHVWVDGKQMDTGDTRKDSTINEADIFTVEHPLTVQQEKLPQNFTVRLSFNLRQFPDGGFGKGNVIASFDMSFAMSKPTVFASLPPDSVGVSTQNDGPSVTGVAQKEDIALDDPYIR